MLDRQLEAFASRGRFLHAVLGLVSWGARIEVLAASPSSDDRPIADHSLTEFFLGIVSLGRSLRATISCADRGASKPRERRPQDVPPDSPHKPRILR